MTSNFQSCLVFFLAIGLQETKNTIEAKNLMYFRIFCLVYDASANITLKAFEPMLLFNTQTNNFLGICNMHKLHL